MKLAASLTLCTLVAALLALAPTPPPRAAAPRHDDPPVDVSKATIDHLGFLAGRWVGAEAGGEPGERAEEHWSGPDGNSIMGMFRWVRADGRPRLFEILTITQEELAGGGIFLRLRHFDAALNAKEDKDKAPMCILKEISKTRAVFSAAENAASLSEIVYELTSPDTLKVTVDLKSDQGPLALVFDLKREKGRGDN